MEYTRQSDLKIESADQYYYEVSKQNNNIALKATNTDRLLFYFLSPRYFRPCNINRQNRKEEYCLCL